MFFGARQIMAAILIAGWPRPVQAEAYPPESNSNPPLPVLDVLGTCPTREALENSLRLRPLPRETSQYRLLVRAEAAATQVVLVDVRGQTLVERTLQSEDCAALAEAVALIVEAYFSELSVSPQRELAQRFPERAAQPTPAKVAAVDLAQGVGTISSVPSSGASRSHRGATQAGIALSLAAGADLLPESSSLAWVAEFGVGLRWSGSQARPRIALGTSTAVTQGEAPDRVSRWASQASLRFGYQIPGIGLEPWGGLGIVMRRLRLLGLQDSGAQTSWSPLVELGVGLEAELWHPWRVRGDVSCGVFGSREIYVVHPDGEIGRGPRFSCGILLGLVWANRETRNR